MFKTQEECFSMFDLRFVSHFIAYILDFYGIFEMRKINDSNRKMRDQYFFLVTIS